MRLSFPRRRPPGQCPYLYSICWGVTPRSSLKMLALSVFTRQPSFTILLFLCRIHSRSNRHTDATRGSCHPPRDVQDLHHGRGTESQLERSGSGQPRAQVGRGVFAAEEENGQRSESGLTSDRSLWVKVKELHCVFTWLVPPGLL